MNRIKVQFFRITVVSALLCAVLTVCGGSPAPVSASAASAPDELDAAIREASTYLNGKMPKNSKTVFLNMKSDYPDLSEYILSVLSENAVNDGIFSVVDRQQLDLIRAELNFQMSEEVSDESAQSIGQMLGAQSIVSGAVNKIGSLYRIQVKAIAVQTAGVQGQWSKNVPSGGATIAALTEKYAPTGTAAVSNASGGGSRTTATAPAATPAAAQVPAEPPPVPENLKIGTVKRTSIDMSWDTVGGAVSYRVYYGTSDNQAAALAGTTRVASYHIENLKGGTTYYFWVSTVENGVESPKSVAASAKTTNIYQIGETGPGGGIVFFDKMSSEGGWRYLEAAPVETELNFEWGANGKDVNGTSTGLGTGKRNTEIIVAYLNRQSDYGRAAQFCAAMEYGEYDDWFMPSKDELNLMYNNLKTKNLGNFSDDAYWSSSEYSTNYAWFQNFRDGSQRYGPYVGYGVFYKDSGFLVRAVRQF